MSTIYLAASGSYPAYNSTGGVSPTFDTVNNRVYFTDATTSGSGTCPFVNFGSQTFNLGTRGFTVVVDFQFVGTAQAWERIIDFNSGTGGVQDMFLSRVGTSTNLRFQYKEAGSERQIDPSYSFAQATRYTVAVTYNPFVGSTGLLAFYVNGDLQATTTPTAIGTDKVYTNTWVGRSSYNADSALSAYIYSLNVYNYPVPLNQITGYTLYKSPYIVPNQVTTYGQGVSFGNIQVSNVSYQTDLISQAAALTPSTSNAAIIQQWIQKSLVQPAYWSNSCTYSTITTITAGNYIGGVLSQDGRVFMTSWSATHTGVFNPATNSFTTVSGSPAGFAGGVLLQDGRIFLTPYTATVIGLINPVTNTYSSGPAATNYLGACLLPDGRVVMSPTGDQKSIGVYNPNTNLFTSYTGNGWQGVGAIYPYDGACLLPDGRVVFVPNAVNHVGIFNSLTNSFTSFTFSDTPGYSSGVYHPNGNVYFAGNGVTNMGIFNTVTNSFTTFSGVSSGFRGLCLLADGTIIFSPWGAITYTNIFNPYTNTLSTITGLLSSGYLGCTLLPDSRVLMIPWSTALGVVTQGPPVSTERCLHPFFNKF
jgi:streptogramin lyase